ncbi:MAG: OmpA family protein [Gallionellaceae bacterium]|nr:OmpA family protein [Gallionellaceae bacterium]MDD5364333.1 OmpA family protein [Gallionellaceae bacterium]
MRAYLMFAILCPVLLSACASTREFQSSSSQQEFQPGPLKVAPELYGRHPLPAVAAEPSPTLPPVVAAAPAVAPVAAAPASASLLTSKDLTAHLRSERSFYFDLDKSDLKADYDPVLKAHASYLAEHPEARVRIEGHADERGSLDYNRRLGLKRAKIVRAELLERGAPDAQVDVKSYGKTKPKLKGHDEESWAENRRADVIYESE